MSSVPCRLAFLIAPIIACGLQLTGCGGDADDASQPGSNDSTAESQAPEEPDDADTGDGADEAGPVDGSATVTLDGTDFTIDVTCTTRIGTSITSTDDSDDTLIVNFNDLGEFTDLTADIQGYSLIYSVLSATESGDEMIGTVSGDTYTVTGSTANLFDVSGPNVDVEVVVTCG